MLARFRPKRKGLTLIELAVTFGLAILLVGLSLYGLRPGKAKTSTLSLAAALADEFRAARQLAVSNGHPVAIGIPTSGSEVANSIYRLEGWNVPLVAWSMSFGGDYPDLGFASARWSPSQGTFTDGAPTPPLSKVTGFDLSKWVPSEHQSDSIFCFTPDGGLQTDGLPALDGRYTVVVAQEPRVSGGTITAGAEAVTIYLSPGGAVEYSKGTPGASLSSAGASVAPAPVKERDNLSGSARIRLSKITVLPEAKGSTSADAFCTPGQQVTFELYAYDPEGRELFTQWTQTSNTNRVGTFTFPRSTTGPLTAEAERMEYVPDPPTDAEFWPGTTPPSSGAFRSRWTWTVPLTSQPGDVYEVEADVQDATGEATIENPPPKMKFPAPPAGRLLAEIWNPTLDRLELVRMNPDGSGRQVLTPPGVEEVMPSIDAGGTKLAFLQGPPGNVNGRYVKVRSLSGGGEFVIAGPGRYTSVSISPNGRWISYRLDGTPAGPGNGTLYFRELDPSRNTPNFSVNQQWGGSLPSTINKSRTGWTSDGRWALWGNEYDLWRTNLATGHSESFWHSPDHLLVSERVFTPTCFIPPGGGGERIVFTIGNVNPYLAVMPLSSPGTPTQVNLGGGGGSGTYNDGLPSVSSDGSQLILPRENFGAGNERTALIALWDSGAGNFVSNPAAPIIIKQDIRSVVWLP